jgi:hypothetical protein
MWRGGHPAPNTQRADGRATGSWDPRDVEGFGKPGPDSPRRFYRTTFVTLPERMQRVQTRILLEPPGVAARTGLRFGLNCRRETLLA